MVKVLIVALRISDFLSKVELNRTETNRNKCKNSLLSKLSIKPGGIVDLSMYKDL